MYAIVRSGGRQHKVAVGDVLEVDRLDDAVGSSISHRCCSSTVTPSPQMHRHSARHR